MEYIQPGIFVGQVVRRGWDPLGRQCSKTWPVRQRGPGGGDNLSIEYKEPGSREFPLAGGAETIRHDEQGEGPAAPWRLDRLGRSVLHLIDLTGELGERAVGLRSLQEGIDTTTPGGRLVFHVFSALAQFEREIIIERSRAGVAAARARGRVGGRPALMTPAKMATARRLREGREHTLEEIAGVIGVSRSTLVRHLAGLEGRSGRDAVRR